MRRVFFPPLPAHFRGPTTTDAFTRRRCSMRWSLPKARFAARRFRSLRSRGLRPEPLEARQMLALTFMGDLNPAFEPADVQNLLADGDQLYFSRETAAEGEELWTSDGTPEGTRLLKDVRPGPVDSWPRPLLAHNGIMYFTIDNFADD